MIGRRGIFSGLGGMVAAGAGLAAYGFGVEPFLRLAVQQHSLRPAGHPPTRIVIEDDGALLQQVRGDGHAQAADVMAVTTTRSASSAKIRHAVEFLVAQLREGPYSLRGQGW